MASEVSPLTKIDVFVADLLAGWNIYTTLITTVLVLFVGYSLIFAQQPDSHPFLLARQSSEAPVRQPGESPTYRSLETPYGFPLRTGLNVKDPSAPKWSGGRDGDLRDIWRAAVRGALNNDGSTTGNQGKIYTVLGKAVKEHRLDDVSQEINIIGQHIRDSNTKVVVVSLSDSVELLATIFVGAFYGVKVVIVPHNLPAEKLASYLKKAQADLLIAEAGAVDLSALLKNKTSLTSVIWVAKQGNKHMDWNEVPEGIGGAFDVAVWHEIVNDKKDSVGSEVPASEPKSQTTPFATVWPDSDDFIEYAPKNFVSGVAALGASLPHAQRLTSSDLLLSIDSLSRSYPLSLIFAALYLNASIGLNSVAGEGVDFAFATAGISPTAIVASSYTMSDYHNKVMAPRTGLLAKVGRYIQARSLDAGAMPTPNLLSRLVNFGPTAELSLDKLRLLFVSHRVDGDPSKRLSSEQLADLRIFTGARVLYALTAGPVAGAITQTNVYDYRRHHGDAHFGAPLSSVEITLTGHEEGAGHERAVQGELSIAGPAVVSGKASLGARARVREDRTLSLV